MTSNGSTHITQMHMQQVIAHYYGRDYMNILGNSVQSAIQATQKALYDFDNPLEPNKVRSLEEQQAGQASPVSGRSENRGAGRKSTKHKR